MSNNTSSKTHPCFKNAPNHHPSLRNNGPNQLGAGNHQNQNLMPFMPNMQPPMNTPPFMNAANPLLPLQKNQLHLSHMDLIGSQLGQSHLGVLGPQNSVGNAGYNPMFPVVGQQIMQNAAQFSLSQLQGQILAQGILNVLQQANMNMRNGQFCGPYPVQNMNQQLPIQVSNPSQVVPSSMHHGSQPMFGFPNQVPQAMVPQNPFMSVDPQVGLVPGNQVRPQTDQNEKNLGVRPTVKTHALILSPFSSQLLQGNSSSSNNSSSSHNPNLVRLHHANNSQPSAFTNSQANPNSNIKTNVRNSTWNGSPSKNFKNKPNREGFKGGLQKSRFHDSNNGKRKIGFPKEHKGKGPNNGRAGHFGSNYEEHRQEPKRSFSVICTEQEIQQWREARRKNHPFNNNIQKKQNEHLKDSKVDRKVLQRELKEILAKQAELGIEVAEIPSYYLKESENQGLQGERKNTVTDKRKFQNKFNKKPDRKGRFCKKQKFVDKGFSDSPSLNKRKPTLLQKLLGADIKRDKSHLLQVFRFMVMNSFFKNSPDKQLIYPSVVVKEIRSEGDAEKTVQKIVSHDNDNGHDSEGEESDDDENDCVVHINPHTEPSSLVKRQCDHNGERIVKSDEEEGEIVD